ncbi:MAG TPA: ATP-binding protein [Longimicrobiales bacterium]|nr:ATP-binding protein [Longimicrobiales bacterium]
MSRTASKTGDPFMGEGRVKELGRQMDWSATSLGPVDRWSPVLRNTVRACLDSPFPINLWCGPELVLVYNDAYSEVLGRKHPRAFGRPGREGWAEIWPEIEPMFQRIREGGPPEFQVDAPFIVQRDHADPPSEPNAWYTFALSAVRDEEGAIVCFLNIVSETTSRVMSDRATHAARAAAERAEGRLRDIFAQAPAFMAMLRGPDHVFEYVNDAYYKLVGNRELLGRPVAEALPEVRGQGYIQLLDQVLRTGQAYTGREMQVSLTLAAGAEPSPRFVDFVYYPVHDSDGDIAGIVAHGYDVTEHVLARAEAHRARNDAEQANRAKSQFLANMSHEIRTPINAVMGYADLLDVGVAGALNGRQTEFVARIRESSRHLLGLVDDILDLSKVEAGEMLVRAEETPLREVIDTAMQIMSPQAETHGLELTIEHRCGPEPRVIGDEGRIRQVLLNLLSNAVKFTPRGGRITVRCSMYPIADPEAALPDVGPWTVVEVEDTGVGIAPDQIEHIFDPFVQADSGHTRLTGGTGLGLTISRRFARLMAGDLTVHSRPGEGSRFLLWLAPAEQQLPGQSSWEQQDALDNLRPAPALRKLGHALLATVDEVEDRLVARLRADRYVRSARDTPTPDIADHTAAVLAIIARTMTALADGSPDDPMVREGNGLQDIMAARHGRQRRRIGWARREIEREYRLLHEVLDRFLRDVAEAELLELPVDDALAVAHRLLDRALGASLRAYDSVE